MHFGVSETALVEVSEVSRERVRELLPELPDYIETLISKLSNDQYLGKHPFTKEEKATFCRAYAETGSVEKSAEKIKVSPPTVYAHLRMDTDFQDAFALAKLSMLDTIQGTSVRMAKMEKGTIDRMCQLRRLAPKVYRETQSQIAVGVSIQFNPHPSAGA